MNTETEILVRAKTLIEGGWTKGTYARDKNLLFIGFDSPNAAYFCMSGAIHRAIADQSPHNSDDGEEPMEIFNNISRHFPLISSLPVYNDNTHRTKEEVLQKFDQAIFHSKHPVTP